MGTVPAQRSARQSTWCKMEFGNSVTPRVCGRHPRVCGRTFSCPDLTSDLLSSEKTCSEAPGANFESVSAVALLLRAATIASRQHHASIMVKLHSKYESGHHNASITPASRQHHASITPASRQHQGKTHLKVRIVKFYKKRMRVTTPFLII